MNKRNHIPLYKRKRRRHVAQEDRSILIKPHTCDGFPNVILANKNITCKTYIDILCKYHHIPCQYRHCSREHGLKHRA